MPGEKFILVFGSNVEGVHGAGTALLAAKKWGAERGVGIGPTGSAYAIATKETWRTGPSSLKLIKGRVDRFIRYAQANPELTFLVVRIGTGNAGLSDEDMAPLFKGAPRNVILHPLWSTYLRRPVVYSESAFLQLTANGPIN